MKNLKIETSGFKRRACTPEEQKRLKKEMEIFCLALEQDEEEIRERGSGLPKDWRNRIFRN